MSIITDGDRELLPIALREHGGFHLATRWYLRDFDPLPYQYAAHHVQQLNLSLKQGIASGKTAGTTASGSIDCISIPYFKILSTSVTAKQAELGFDMFMSWMEGNERLEHLVEDVKLRPWPVIKFKNFSQWEFRTAGVDGRFIRGTEYDRIIYDECGLDMAGEIVKILRGRLRGRRPDGSIRMARMDCLSSPTDAMWWVERFKKGWKGSGVENLRQYLSMKVTTYQNTRLTREQVALMEAEYTDEMIDVELNAEDPDYGMSMFPKRHINACTSQAMNDQMYIATVPEEGVPRKGWHVEEHPRHGITKWEMGWDPKGHYIMAGDPGTDEPPRRNAANIMVLNISKRPAQVVYFDWVYGKGSYMPFLHSYKYAMDKYRPSIKALDTTGTQKAMQELAFEQLGIATDGINFSRDKDAALNALSLAITNHEIEWPVIKGLLRQISTYTRDADKKSDFPQDITMTAAMAAFVMRHAPESFEENVKPSKHVRSRSRRTSSSRRR